GGNRAILEPPTRLARQTRSIAAGSMHDNRHSLLRWRRSKLRHGKPPLGGLMNFSPRKGRYGVDAPYAPLGMGIGLLGCLGLVVFAHIHAFLISALILALLLVFYLHTTLRGKFAVWRDLLDAQAWRGDEQVLDLGCGRGAILLMVAAFVPRGRATGVDIWSSMDQSGNEISVTARNAEAEGVADRIELKTADMRELPFADDSFDLVVSNVAIHNIADAAGRDRAIAEAWRVLRPGGTLLIADISRSRQYCRLLNTLGAHAERRNLGWRMWWGGPWVPTMLVSTHKAAGLVSPDPAKT
ncbi:MAG: class I SAM-dependent methyltransferase, partial [Rhodanobacter sp.]